MMMKRIKISILGTVIMTMFLLSCSDILDEQPRSIYEPGFFETERGILGGIDGMYAHLRYIYGNGYYFNACETGTDEYTYAQSADNNFKDMDLSGVGTLTAASSRSDALWGTAFSNINNANGIIENGTAIGTSEALISEARFFRAFDYFLLVQTFGGVPLDLGSGELRFNIQPVRTSYRNNVPEVYTRVIFPDLVTAVENLPATGRVAGGATKTAARLLLAKAYLTYAWWLENPNSIPTYPEADRTDPDGHTAAWYYQEAYNTAVDAIDDPGPFGLQPTFYDIHRASNDRNNEILIYADHTQSSAKYNGASLEYSNGQAPDNFSIWMATWNYTELRSGIDAAWSGTAASVQREAVQSLGRPWTRMAPTIGVFENTFADKTNDARYDGTFTTVYRGNWPKGGTSNASLYNANLLQVFPGDPILKFLPVDPAPGTITYPAAAGHSNIGAGEMAGEAAYVVSPSGISRIVYPGLWKLGAHRTDNGTGLGQPNAASVRPYNVLKFSELYFVAAEAAVKGANTRALTNANPIACDGTATGLLNVIRYRAGKWVFDNAGNQAKIADNSAAMTAATPAVITIDYILQERSREYFGEGYRWHDLVRTQKWNDFAGSYRICGATKGDHTAVTVTRTILPYQYLRPIPSGQIDALNMTEAEKYNYQNPVYRDL